MKLFRKNILTLYSLLILLNIILRFQSASHEIGFDSFGVHILANSLSEYGYAKWILNPLSIFGLYPLSYASSVPFVISGSSQITGMEMEKVIFIYTISIGILSILTAYIFANALYPENDVFKFISAAIFSTSPAILTYSTWSIPTRGLLIILAPLLLYLILNVTKSLKFVFLTFVLAVFLFATHHMFYFIIPSFFAFVIALILKLDKHELRKKKLEKVTPFVFIISFLMMFSIPFCTGKFLDVSRYSPIYISYTRYIGILIPFSVSGLIYLIFKSRKIFTELFLLLNLIFLTPFIYKQTYLKWYIPVLISPLIAIGLINLINSAFSKKTLAVSILLLSSVIFSGYYQFLHDYDYSSPFNERSIEHSTFLTGDWIKNNIQTSVLSNDELFALRLLATAEKVHQPTSSAMNNFIYDFAESNLSNFEYYSIESEEFFYSTGKGIQDMGQTRWYDFNQMKVNYQDFGISYFVENTKSYGNLAWTHQSEPSKLLHKAYTDSDLIYDTGTAKIWNLNSRIEAKI